jgi:predicted nucleotidyltransferase
MNMPVHMNEPGHCCPVQQNIRNTVCQKSVLFGSHIRGDFEEYSFIDLLVLTESPDSIRPLLALGMFIAQGKIEV